MKPRKNLILLCVTALFVFLICYVRCPVTVAMVAKKLPKGSPWREDIKEIEVDNLHNKMGLQLFQLQSGDARAFFLVNRFQFSEPIDFSGDSENCCCMDYDNNGQWEFLYLSNNPMRSFCVPQIYIYELHGGKIYLEAVYSLEGANSYVDKPILSMQKDGNLYINFDEERPENNVYIQYNKGKLFCYRENGKILDVMDDTEAYRKKQPLEFSDLK